MPGRFCTSYNFCNLCPPPTGGQGWQKAGNTYTCISQDGGKYLELLGNKVLCRQNDIWKHLRVCYHLNTCTYQTTHTNLCELNDCRCKLNEQYPINIPPKVPNSVNTPTKLNALTNAELNDFPPKVTTSADTSTKLQAPTGVNLTTAADQHSLPGTKIS